MLLRESHALLIDAASRAINPETWPAIRKPVSTPLHFGVNAVMNSKDKHSLVACVLDCSDTGVRPHE